MGSDGFIAVEDEEGALVWAVFFTTSNPFVEVRSEGELLVATSEHAPKYGPVYRINPEHPEIIGIGLGGKTVLPKLL